MRVCLFDGAWWEGHNRWFVPGVVEGLADGGAEVHVMSGNDPGPRAQSWAHAPRSPARQYLRSALSHAAVVRWANRLKPEVYIDSYFDISVSRSWPALAFLSAPRAQFILHTVNGVTNPSQKVSSRVRASVSIANARLIARRSNWGVVVHTERAQAKLSEVRICARLLELPTRPLASLREANPYGPFLLYVGDTRRGKGYDELLQAYQFAGSAPKLVVVGGRSSEDLPAGAINLGFVNDDDLAQLFRWCAAVVAPYTEHFRDSGAASSVVREALSVGTPVIVPSWMVADFEPTDLLIPFRPGCAVDLGEKIAAQTPDRGNGFSVDFGTYVRSLVET